MEKKDSVLFYSCYKTDYKCVKSKNCLCINSMIDIYAYILISGHPKQYLPKQTICACYLSCSSRFDPSYRIVFNIIRNLRGKTSFMLFGETGYYTMVHWCFYKNYSRMRKTVQKPTKVKFVKIVYRYLYNIFTKFI